MVQPQCVSTVLPPFTPPVSGQTLFRDADEDWVPLPDWVKGCLQLGYCWPIHDERRRICIVSSPCESVASGLILLGAIIRRLEDDHADDISDHFGRLSRLRQGDGVELRHAVRPGAFRFHRRDPNGSIWVEEVVAERKTRNHRKPTPEPERLIILPANANDWRFGAGPPVAARPGQALPFHGFYSALAPSPGRIRLGNLETTDSLLAIAGRPTGQSPTETAFRAAQFRCGRETSTLADLLAVQRWQPLRVSRARFYNTRANVEDPFDRPGPPPRLVVADGSEAFRRTYSSDVARRASLVGVTCRVVDASLQEEFAEFLGGLAQWFEPDAEWCPECPDLPDAISVHVLREQERG